MKLPRATYTYGSFPDVPTQAIDSKILRADGYFRSWCFFVSICVLCMFSLRSFFSPRIEPLDLSQRNVQILDGMKHSTLLAATDGSAYNPKKGSMIPNVIGCMQTNCMGIMQQAYKGGDTQSQGVMKCMNDWTGDDQHTCLSQASAKDDKVATDILGCGTCNGCYMGEKPDNCAQYKGSNWSNNVPSNYIPAAYRGFINGGKGKGKGNGSSDKPSSKSNGMLLTVQTAGKGSGFDYSQYMNGGGKGSGSGAGFDYSKYMNGGGDYSKYQSEYMPGAKKNDGSAASGGFDYSQYMQGKGSGKGDASPMMLVAESAPPPKSEAASAPAPPAKSEDVSAPAVSSESAPPASKEATPEAKADAKEAAAPAKEATASKEKFDYSQYTDKYMDSKNGGSSDYSKYQEQYAGDYSKYMSGGGGGGGYGGYYSQYAKQYVDEYAKQYMSGGGGGGGGGKDFSPQDMVKKMIDEKKSSAEIGDAFKKKYASDYIRKYSEDDKAAKTPVTKSEGSSSSSETKAAPSADTASKAEEPAAAKTASKDEESAAKTVSETGEPAAASKAEEAAAKTDDVKADVADATSKTTADKATSTKQ